MGEHTFLNNDETFWLLIPIAMVSSIPKKKKKKTYNNTVNTPQLNVARHGRPVLNWADSGKFVGCKGAA